MGHFRFNSKTWKAVTIPNLNNLKADILFKVVYYDNPGSIFHLDAVAIPFNITPEEILVLYDPAFDIQEIASVFYEGL